MSLQDHERAAVRLAFRLALLDAVPQDGTAAERCAALHEARDRLSTILSAEGEPAELPDILCGIRDRAVLAAALQGGFEEALMVVTSRPR